MARLAPLFSILLGMVAISATVPDSPAQSIASDRRVVRVAIPKPIEFTEKESGYVVDVWVNGAGPFVFALDTGAGGTVISESVAAAAKIGAGRPITVAGLSGRLSPAREVAPAPLAAGSANNRLPGWSKMTISKGLPAGVDGLLDPSTAFWPLGFVIDVPAGSLSAFDPVATPIAKDRIPAGGTVTTWVMRGSSRRPYVALADNRTALIDTGSGLGLVVSNQQAIGLGITVDGNRRAVRIRDVGGGTVEVRRTAIRRVRLGSMLLENAPTDVMTGAEPNAPILLGRDVLRPFVIEFDPRSRLIRFGLK